MKRNTVESTSEITEMKESGQSKGGKRAQTNENKIRQTREITKTQVRKTKENTMTKTKDKVTKNESKQEKMGDSTTK
jgi:hypothetical protein